MKRIALLAVLVVAACGSFGLAQPQTLSLAYKPGDTYKYKFHSTTKQTAGVGGMTIPIEFDLTARESVTVKSVDSSGLADLTITLSDVTFKSVAAGVTNTTTGTPVESIEVKIHRDGSIASVEGNALPADNPLTALSGLGGNFFVAAVLPAYPVKASDTWSKSYDQTNPSGLGGVHITSKSTYLRDETFDGVNAAVVETKSTATIEASGTKGATPTASAAADVSVSGTLTTDVTTWIDPNGHRIMQSRSTAQDEMTIVLPPSFGPTGTTDKTTPLFAGPLTAKGGTTTDLTPA